MHPLARVLKSHQPQVFLRCLPVYRGPPQRPSAGTTGHHPRCFARNISSLKGAIKKNQQVLSKTINGLIEMVFVIESYRIWIQIWHKLNSELTVQQRPPKEPLCPPCKTSQSIGFNSDCLYVMLRKAIIELRLALFQMNLTHFRSNYARGLNKAAFAHGCWRFEWLTSSRQQLWALSTMDEIMSSLWRLSRALKRPPTYALALHTYLLCLIHLYAIFRNDQTHTHDNRDNHITRVRLERLVINCC